MKKLFLLLILATFLVSCKNPVQDNKPEEQTTKQPAQTTQTAEPQTVVTTDEPEVTDPVITTPETTEPEITPDPVVPVNPWTEAVCDETDTDCSVSYIYVPKGWNPVDFNKDVYEQFSERTEENFDFLNFEKVGTLTFNSTDEDVIKADSTYIFSRYMDVYNEPDEYYTEIDYYKVSIKKDFDLDFIPVVYQELSFYNAFMGYNYWLGYTLEKSEDDVWYIYTAIWINNATKKEFVKRVNNPNDFPKYPKLAINNYQ